MINRPQNSTATVGDSSDEPSAERRQEHDDPEPEAAIVGVGNRLLRDDGVGPRVIDVLEESIDSPSAKLCLYDAGTTGFFALEAMSGCERAIVVDAIQTGHDSGTVQEYRFRDGGFDEEVPQVTMHDISFTEALTFARDVYDFPEDVRIIGVEPESLGTGLGLTEPVRNALPAILERITRYEPTIDPEQVTEIDPIKHTTIDSAQFQNDTPSRTTHEVRDI